MRPIGFIFLFFLAVQSSGQGIEFFKGTWKEGFEKAEAEGKIIFVDAFAKWCGPCKRMAREVFTQDKVGKMFNDNFINLKIDMEEPGGLEFGKTYRVSAYPTLFFIKSDGEVINKITGARSADALIDLGRKAIQSDDRSGDFEEDYKNGKRDYTFMLDYVRELNKVGKPSLKIANDYMNSNPDISRDQSDAFLFEAATEADSKIFEALLDRKETVRKQFGEEAFSLKVMDCAWVTVDKGIEYDYYALVEEAIDKVDKSGVPGAEKFEYRALMQYALSVGQYDEWKKKAKKFLKKFGKEDPEVYGEVLGTLRSDLKYDADSKKLAVEYAEQWIKLEDSGDNYYRYLQVLLEAGQKDKARKIAREAIEIAKSRKEDYRRFEGMLRYIESI